jgi:hypothetical protein
MALFLVEHRHEPEKCPAGDPKMASMLLKHLSTDNAASYEIQLKGEVVIQGGHRLYLIAEAKNQETVRRFMEPFSHAGSVDVLPASTCEEVVARGVC